ncbi:MAG: hypothetical protein IKA05_05395 [Clostridia bacterium]|nr:hypothetical protein [Clostridia bacterium]
MIIYDWIVSQLLPIFLPETILDFILFYVKNPNVDGVSHPVTVEHAIGAFFALVTGYCCVYFLAWVPFRGILHLIRWKRWRGY